MKKICLLLLFLNLFVHCTNEDLSRCKVVFHFLYDNNVSNLDLLLKEVEIIDIYVYDKADNKLVATKQLTPKNGLNNIEVPLYTGEFYAVAWGNIHSDTQNGVLTGKENLYHYDIEEQILIFPPDDKNYTTPLLPVFHGFTDGISIGNEKQREVQISLIKNTKLIDIQIFGNDNMVDCEVSNDNSNHTINNIPRDKMGSIPLRHDYNTETKETLFQVRTHRLNGVSDKNSLLKIKSRDLAGGEISYSFVSLIKAGFRRGASNTPAMEQLVENMLDRYDQFNIQIYLDNSQGQHSILLYVNGYLVIQSTPDI